MGADRSYAYGAAAGLLGDLLLGDPQRMHPVAAFGRAAGRVERVLWHDHRGWGTLHTLVCAGGATALGVVAARAVRAVCPRPAASAALTAAATWAVVGGTSLAREASAVGRALERGDLAAARARLPHLCGRDPEALDAA
ncbi:cobalamin biosynthesis protein, partial [Streptomyces sp. SID1328]|uniref:cobalamin biosynthesis protein n=1 Tax=Streptomyces sp. SID1328 TaxID=2690250 RepID=UPI0013941DF3